MIYIACEFGIKVATSVCNIVVIEFPETAESMSSESGSSLRWDAEPIVALGAKTAGLTIEVTARFLAGVDSKLRGRAPVTSAFWPGRGGCGGVGPSGFKFPV